MQGKNQQRSKKSLKLPLSLNDFCGFFQAARFGGKNHQQRNFLHFHTFEMPKGTVKMKIQLEECQVYLTKRAFEYTSWFFEGFRYLVHNTSFKDAYKKVVQYQAKDSTHTVPAQH